MTLEGCKRWAAGILHAGPLYWATATSQPLGIMIWRDGRADFDAYRSASGPGSGHVDHLLHPVHPRSFSARRVRGVRAALDADHPALRWPAARILPAARGDQQHRTRADRVCEP